VKASCVRDDDIKQRLPEQPRRCHDTQYNDTHNADKKIYTQHIIMLSVGYGNSSLRSHDTQYNDTQYNDTQYNDTQYKDTQYNDTQYNDTQYNDAQHIDTQHNADKIFYTEHIIMLSVGYANSSLRSHDSQCNDIQHI
jgi:hypothetical protein